jgi:hypothetical protein
VTGVVGGASCGSGVFVAVTSGGSVAGIESNVGEATISPADGFEDGDGVAASAFVSDCSGAEGAPEHADNKSDRMNAVPVNLPSFVVIISYPSPNVVSNLQIAATHATTLPLRRATLLAPILRLTIPAPIE